MPILRFDVASLVVDIVIILLIERWRWLRPIVVSNLEQVISIIDSNDVANSLDALGSLRSLGWKLSSEFQDLELFATLTVNQPVIGVKR